MWTVISACFVVITCVAGITELLSRFWLYLMRPKGDPPRVMLVFLKDDICLQQLHSAMEYISWQGGKLFCSIAAIDCGLSEKNKKVVKDIVDKNSNIIFGNEALADCIKSFMPNSEC